MAERKNHNISSSDLKIEIIKNFLNAIIYYFENILEKDKRPEKQWFYNCVSSVRRKAKNVSNPEALCAWVWYYHTGEKRLRDVLKQTYGKLRGEAKEKLSHALGLRAKRKKGKKKTKKSFAEITYTLMKHKVF